MFICQLGMHNNVQGHRNENVCKQTYDASCMPHMMEVQFRLLHLTSSAAQLIELTVCQDV